jgi:hypothetical protein
MNSLILDKASWWARAFSITSGLFLIGFAESSSFSFDLGIVMFLISIYDFLR